MTEEAPFKVPFSSNGSEGNEKSSSAIEKSIEHSRLLSIEKKEKYDAMLSQLVYDVPPTSAPFDSSYSLEVLKNGSIVDTITFSSDKSFFVIGRIPSCDIVAEHPTLSRMHAIIQFATGSEKDSEIFPETGLYIYDLKSTHGTFLNKNQLFPNRYYRLKVGHVLKFGSSTRLYIVKGPASDEEEESDKTVTELIKEKNEKELERLKKNWNRGSSNQEATADDEISEVSWGMGEDAVEEIISINPYALDTDLTELNIDNPKLTLKNWFEREGYELFYDVKEKASGHFHCVINLPLDGPGNSSVIAEFDGKGKRKDIITQCALKACQILDKYGVLRRSSQDGFKRKQKNWEEKDYYSSDEDIFLDRTGSVENKRKLRMKQAGKISKDDDENKVENFESLKEKYSKVQTHLDDLKLKIQAAEEKEKADNSDVDPLDAFMSDLKSGVSEMKTMKLKVKELNEELSRILKLINIVKPRNVVFPESSTPKLEKEDNSNVKRMKMLFGPRKTIPSAASKYLAKNSTQAKEEIIITSEVEEEEEDEDESKNTENSILPQEIKIAPSPEPIIVEKNDNCDKVDEEMSSSSKTEVTNKRRNRKPREKKEVNYEYDSNNPDYSVWVPPLDQAGDGKTALNDKLGY